MCIGYNGIRLCPNSRQSRWSSNLLQSRPFSIIKRIEMKKFLWIIFGSMILTAAYSASQVIPTPSILAASGVHDVDGENKVVTLQMLDKCEQLAGSGVGDFDFVIEIKNCDSREIVSLKRMVSRDKNLQPIWKLLDYKILPKFSKKHAYGDMDCSDGKHSGIVAVTSPWIAIPEKTYAESIYYAAYANSETSKIETINPADVVCEFFDDRG